MDVGALRASADATQRRLQEHFDQGLQMACRRRDKSVRGAALRRRAERERRRVSLATAVLAAVSLAACGSSSSSKTAAGVKGGSEVRAAPVSTAGANPFTPKVGADMRGVRPPAAAAGTSGGAATYTASLPGLYGGTRNYKTCDAAKLENYLAGSPAKAQAWASTLGIRVPQIRDYVSHLTPVLLRTDTRVTNHGYVNGVADPLQSVLEAGTAVFVNQYGAPVVKCYCGNPLTAPVLYTAPVYTGPLWATFNVTQVTIINQSSTIINTFTLYDPNTGSEFKRGAGQAGGDGPYLTPAGANPAPGATPGSTPAPAPGTPTPAPAPSRPAENPSITLSPNPVTQGDAVTLSGSGFAPGASVAIKVVRPDGNVDNFGPVTADSSGAASFTFPSTGGGTLTGTFQVTATNTASGASASSSVDVVPAATSTGSSSSGNATP